MTALALVLAFVLGLLLIGFGVIEAFFSRSKRFFPLFRIRDEHAPAVRIWTINVGFYNIVWGLGIIVGAILATVGEVVVGKTMVLFVAAAMIVLGLVLLLSDPRLWRGAAVQGGLGLIVLLAWLV